MAPEVKERIDQIRHGIVPEGYIKSKDGIYPGDWTSKKIGQWLQPMERPISLEDEEKYELVTVRRGFGGVDSRGTYWGKNVLVKNYFGLRTGDFVISKRQIAHGACGVVPVELDGAVVSNEYNVFVPQEGTNINMFNLMMQLPHYKRLFYLMSDGVHIEKLLFKTDDWMRRSLAMPSLEEQEKIAAILTMQDKVIELKGKLLAEKQQQKKYLMQQLLTGKKRLMGFEGEWKKDNLGALFTERVETNCEHMELLAITGTQGVIPRCWLDLKDNSSEDKSKYLHICFGDIGYNTMRMWQGVSAYSNYEGIVSPAYTILKPKDEICAKYFSYLFKLPEIVFLFYRFSQGLVDDTRNLKYENFSKIKVKFPNDESEQEAISKVFEAVDEEIKLLQQNLVQEKQKKKALMQLLLTGIVRV